MHDPLLEHHLILNRRTFLHSTAVGIGGMAQGSLLSRQPRKISPGGSLLLRPRPNGLFICSKVGHPVIS